MPVACWEKLKPKEAATVGQKVKKIQKEEATSELQTGGREGGTPQNYPAVG